MPPISIISRGFGARRDDRAVRTRILHLPLILGLRKNVPLNVHGVHIHGQESKPASTLMLSIAQSSMKTNPFMRSIDDPYHFNFAEWASLGDREPFSHTNRPINLTSRTEIPATRHPIVIHTAASTAYCGSSPIVRAASEAKFGIIQNPTSTIHRELPATNVSICLCPHPDCSPPHIFNLQFTPTIKVINTIGGPEAGGWPASCRWDHRTRGQRSPGGVSGCFSAKTCPLLQ